MSSYPPTLPPVEMGSDGFNSDTFASPTTANGNGHVLNDAPAAATFSTSDAVAPPVSGPEKASAPVDPNIAKAVDAVLYSDIGVNTLLNRLKQSIASVRDFASFLKKRGALEEEHASGLKKICRATYDAIRKQEGRHGSYVRQFEELLKVNERMTDNGSTFGISLHQMQEDLNELANNMERGRKQWKQTGLAAEKRVLDAEALMEKAKAKYDSLAEDYDRVKTGDTGAGRKFGIKGPKSAAQHEEDLHRKLQAADADYLSKVQAAQAQRQELITTQRPQAIKAVKELITECDSALTLQMQKFVAFNERLLLDDGMCISPVNINDGREVLPPSLRELVCQIDNDKDFQQYITSFTPKIPVRSAEMKYEKHPTLVQPQAQPTPPPTQRQSLQMSTSQPPPSFSLQQQESLPSPQKYQPPQQYPPQQQQQQQQQQQPQQQPPPPLQQSYQAYNSGYQPPPPQKQQTAPYGAPPQQPSFPPSNPSHYPGPSYGLGPAGQKHAPQTMGVTYSNPPPIKPVFGVSLDELFRRDGSPVPMVVYECIQAVDLFGLEAEGIYRVPGTSSHIQAMKALFDNDSSKVDFRNPDSFYHDVNSVAGLLKQFFRDLPDPLLTSEHYTEFIDAARIDDDTVRRDSMHAIINALPDPNYATLRALVLHLNRVQAHSQANRMSTNNLGICFAPTVMGPHRGPMSDAGLQARVVNTILDNVFQIFDED